MYKNTYLSSDTGTDFDFSSKIREFFDPSLRQLYAVRTAVRDELPVSIIEHSDWYEIHVDAPGARKEELKLRIDEDAVSIDYVPIEMTPEKKGGESAGAGRMIFDERQRSRMRRVLRFGVELADEGNSAKFENGVLSVHVMKRAPVRSAVRELSIA